ncbi:hypothetical protein [Nonomuraea sp. NPDC003214]
MLATRTARSRRPATSAAGRLAGHALLVIVMVLGAVFAHGGACAAVELSEQAGHSADAGVVTADHDAHCRHRQLPAGHQHGTEQNCSAVSPASPPAGAPAHSAAAVSHPPAAAAVAAPSAATIRLTAPYREDLCVMRI